MKAFTQKSNYWNEKPKFIVVNITLPRRGANWMRKVPRREDVEVCCGRVSPPANCSFPQKHLFELIIQILCQKGECVSCICYILLHESNKN